MGSVTPACDPSGAAPPSSPLAAYATSPSLPTNLVWWALFAAAGLSRSRNNLKTLAILATQSIGSTASSSSAQTQTQGPLISLLCVFNSLGIRESAAILDHRLLFGLSCGSF
ncbi:hypothetical protein ZWY2020_010648 [Hordeum vulgare]|nr:hypothetical protein ZWY2020_010648 [Hordeum vulgare]